MDQMIKDRRRVSYCGLIDSAIRSGSKLISTGDSTTRVLANQVLSDLLRLRREMPARRQYDVDIKNRKV